MWIINIVLASIELQISNNTLSRRKQKFVKHSILILLEILIFGSKKSLNYMFEWPRSSSAVESPNALILDCYYYSQ